MNITRSREFELMDLVEENLGQRSWFDYHDWDGFIECDELLTAAELDWMRQNFTILVTVKKVLSP